MTPSPWHRFLVIALVAALAAAAPAGTALGNTPENSEDEEEEKKNEEAAVSPAEAREVDEAQSEAKASARLRRQGPGGRAQVLTRRPRAATLARDSATASTSDFLRKEAEPPEVLIEWFADVPEEFREAEQGASSSSSAAPAAPSIFNPPASRADRVAADHDAMVEAGRTVDRNANALADAISPSVVSRRSKREFHQALKALGRAPMPEMPHLGGTPRHFAEVLRSRAELGRRSEDVREVFDLGRAGAVPRDANDVVSEALEGGWTGRLDALIEAIDRANVYKASLGNGKDAAARSQMVDAFLDAATAHRDALQTQLSDMIRDYPNSLARGHTPNLSFGSAGGEGANSATVNFTYDFDNGRSDPNPNAEPNAVFKEEPAVLNQTAGLDALGVDLDGGHPMRLSMRATASYEVARALDMGDLMVRTELASPNGLGGRFGIVMERAVGQVPVTDGWSAIASDTPAAQELARVTQTRDNAREARDDARRDLDRARLGRRNRFEPPTPQEQAAIDRAETALKDRETAYNNAERTFQAVGRFTRSRIRGGRQIFEEAKSLRRLTDQELAAGTLRRDLADAQLLDALCGQVDRHMGNLMRVIDRDGNIRIKLFDNDLAFGTGNYHLRDPDPFGNLTALPKTVDVATKRAILALTPDALAQRLAGLLSPGEIQAVGERLQQIQSHLRSPQTLTASLNGQGADVAWSTSNVQDLFHNHDGGARRGERSSYFGEIVTPEFQAPAQN